VKQALIEFAVGFAATALTVAAVAGLLKVAGLILEKVGVAAGVATSMQAAAVKMTDMGSHSKQSFLAWINHIFS
jgi:hypothetical protein